MLGKIKYYIMKKFFFIVSVLCLSYSCNKYDIPECDFVDATQDLLWLKTIIDEREANPTEGMKYCYIVQAELQRKTVFIFGDCNPSIDKLTFVLNCEGEPILDNDGENIIANQEDITNQILIWSPDDFICNFDQNL